MTNSSFQLQYDEMTSIAKNFKDEGEDIARLHADTRQRVRDLYKEWVGEGAEKFFEEMETNLLPAVQRLSNALFESQDAANEIMKIIQSADEETAGFFRNELAGDDFGAGLFGQASQGIQSGSSSSSDDFGAGKFGEALGNPPADSNDAGAGALGDATSSQESAQEPAVDEQLPQEETTSEAGSTSGGGGGGSSQGLQGDLSKMGTGLVGGSPSQTAVSGGGGTSGPANMPDHLYSGGDSPSPSGNESGSGVGAGSGSGGGSASSESGVAAGVAGVAGAAAAGGAAKGIKKQKNKMTNGNLS